MPLIIKGKLIDKNNPVICVPITERNHDDIILKATEAVRLGVSMVEWRADFFCDLFDNEKLIEILSALKSIFVNTVFLVTVRSVYEGGEVSVEEDELRELLIAIARTHCADIIDVEYFEYTAPDSLIKILQECGSAVVASYHDIKNTPSKDVNIRLLETMAKADPDIVKLAVMAKNTMDVFKVGEASCELYEMNPDMLAICIAMGKYGKMTRLAPKVFNSCVTFGSMGKNSAPGQIEYKKLKESLEFFGDDFDV